VAGEESDRRVERLCRYSGRKEKREENRGKENNRKEKSDISPKEMSDLILEGKESN
jgi:hypothetical protein